MKIGTRKVCRKIHLRANFDEPESNLNYGCFSRMRTDSVFYLEYFAGSVTL